MDALSLEETVPSDRVEVLPIVRKKFICEQISISERLELAFIKIQTYKHVLIVTACYLPPIYSK